MQSQYDPDLAQLSNLVALSREFQGPPQAQRDDGLEGLSGDLAKALMASAAKGVGELPGQLVGMAHDADQNRRADTRFFRQLSAEQGREQRAQDFQRGENALNRDAQATAEDKRLGVDRERLGVERDLKEQQQRFTRGQAQAAAGDFPGMAESYGMGADFTSSPKLVAETRARLLAGIADLTGKQFAAEVINQEPAQAQELANRTLGMMQEARKAHPGQSGEDLAREIGEAAVQHLKPIISRAWSGDFRNKLAPAIEAIKSGQFGAGQAGQSTDEISHWGEMMQGAKAPGWLMG